jgi:SAM-dependent methyltransferase
VDLGCGDCPYKDWFVEAGCRYIDCDIDGRASVTISPGQRMPLADASADGVVSFQVLEHVWELDWYLYEAKRILVPGGWLLLSTHGSWLYHPHPTDFRRWTVDGIAMEIQERGFAIDLVRGLVGPLAWTTQFRLLGVREVLRRIPFVGPAILAPLICLANVRMVVEDFITPESIKQRNGCVYLVLAHK